MKVQEVFDIAVRLMDEQNESTGATQTADTREYQVRTCSILNSVLDRVYPYSGTYPGRTGRERPACPRVKDMEDELAVDDVIASTVLPFWMAYLFSLSDSSDSTAHFRAMFEQAFAGMAAGAAAEAAAVEDMYGGIEYGRAARW